jgi:hypothetical protein
MSKLIHVESHGVGTQVREEIPSNNHFALATTIAPGVKVKIASMGLQRVAGNVYECPSTKDFWKVKGNSIVRLTAEEVDNHERIAAAPAQAPMGFLDEILGSLE